MKEDPLASGKMRKTKKDSRSKKLKVTEDDIADVVSGWTKIPVRKIAEGEAYR